MGRHRGWPGYLLIASLALVASVAQWVRKSEFSIRAVRDAAASADDLWFALAGTGCALTTPTRPLCRLPVAGGRGLEIWGLCGARAYALAVRGGDCRAVTARLEGDRHSRGPRPGPFAAGDVLAVGGDVGRGRGRDAEHFQPCHGSGRRRAAGRRRREELLAIANDYNEDGFRVLVVATRHIPASMRAPAVHHRR